MRRTKVECWRWSLCRTVHPLTRCVADGAVTNWRYAPLDQAPMKKGGLAGRATDNVTKPEITVPTRLPRTWRASVSDFPFLSIFVLPSHAVRRTRNTRLPRLVTMCDAWAMGPSPEACASPSCRYVRCGVFNYSVPYQ
jgi:hypothetical protein